MNKKIWILWLQGWDKAPNISLRCVESWRHYNPEWEVVLLDSKNISQYLNLEEVLPGLDTNNISLSNIIRISLIQKYGGVWADSTLYCNRSLDEWLPSSAFLFHQPTPDRMISDWFIAGTPESPIIQTWYSATIQWWRLRIEHTNQYEQRYGWSHSLFGLCYNQNKLFKDTWDNTLKIGADCSPTSPRGSGPHYFVPYHEYYFTPMSQAEKDIIDSKVDPVYKLSYKVNTDWRSPDSKGIHPGQEKIITPYVSGSCIDYLLNKKF